MKRLAHYRQDVVECIALNTIGVIHIHFQCLNVDERVSSFSLIFGELHLGWGLSQSGLSI